MARKRPLVVSFRRIQKMTPNNLDNCNSVSICDIHRLDTKLRDNNEILTMKIMSKYGSNPTRIAMQKNVHCGDNQSCRNFQSHEKHKTHMDSLYDESDFEPNHTDKGCVFPKEKFYGNAKLLLTVNDDVLRKAIIDYDKDTRDSYADSRHTKSQRNVSSKDKTTSRNRLTFKSDMKKRMQATSPSSDDNKVIDESSRYHRGTEMKNHFLLRDKDCRQRFFESAITAGGGNSMENGTSENTLTKMNKSSSAPTVFQAKKLSSGTQWKENGKAHDKSKHVSMLSIHKMKI